MKIITPPLVIKNDEGFKQDSLGRQSYGEALTNLVSRSNDALVISLDGQWGEGKTTFVKMWQGLLLEKGIPNIYIDAFANDYVDDAFISVVSAISDYAKGNITEDEFNTLIEKSKKVGGKLLSFSARIGIKVATLGLIKDAEIEELNEIKSDLSKATSDLVGDFIEDRINSYSKDIKAIELFKEFLSELPAKLQTDTNYPLVIIIDELDRCKPTFAVEILEKIKHLFSVENIIFLLVMNKEQLEESIKSVYGQNIDAHTYLQKFISIEAKLPKNTLQAYQNDLYKYIRKLSELHELDAEDDKRKITETLEALSIHFNISLRQLEKIYTSLVLFYMTEKEYTSRPVNLIVFLAVLKVIKPKLFKKLSHQKLSFDDLSNILEFNKIPHNREYRVVFENLILFIKTCLLPRDVLDESKLQDFEIYLYDNFCLKREEAIPFFAKSLDTFYIP